MNRRDFIKVSGISLIGINNFSFAGKKKELNWINFKDKIPPLNEFFLLKDNSHIYAVYEITKNLYPPKDFCCACSSPSGHSFRYFNIDDLKKNKNSRLFLFDIDSAKWILIKNLLPFINETRIEDIPKGQILINAWNENWMVVYNDGVNNPPNNRYREINIPSKTKWIKLSDGKPVYINYHLIWFGKKENK